MAIKMNVYDWSAAELIHSYVDLHFDDFCSCNIESDMSELEYVINNFIDFRDWADALGYEIEK